jgi:hypothetical protein
MDLEGRLKALLQAVGVDPDGLWANLPDQARTAALNKVADSLQELLGLHHGNILQLLDKFIEDPAAALKDTVIDFLSRWLSAEGVGDSTTVATALVAFFENPKKYFADYEWLTMPGDTTDYQQQYHDIFRRFRQFVYTWQYGIFTDAGFSDPSARPNVFAAAAACGLSTKLVTLACGKAADAAKADAWLQAIEHWGMSDPYDLPEGWLLSSITPQAVTAGRWTVRDVLELVWG